MNDAYAENTVSATTSSIASLIYGSIREWGSWSTVLLRGTAKSTTTIFSF